MAIKQSMSRPINADIKGVKAVVNEAADGIQAVPTELVIKAADDSTFTQISEATPMPVKVVGGGGGTGGTVTVGAPLPAGTNKIGTVDAQLSGALPAGANKIGSVDAVLTGSYLREQKTEANAVSGVLTFSEAFGTVEIYNTDPVNTGVFNVNGIPITVPATKVFKASIGGTPNVNVTITGSTMYIVSRYT